MRKLLLFGMLLLQSHLITAQSTVAKANPSILWKYTHSSAFNNDLCQDVIYIDKAGNTILAGNSNNWDQSKSIGQYWVSFISKDGKKLWQQEINKQTQVSSVEHAKKSVKAITQIDNGNILVIVDIVDFSPTLFKLDVNGKVLLQKNILDKNSKINVFRIVYTPDKQLYLVGSRNGNLYIVKIDANGNKLSEKEFDNGSFEVPTSSVADYLSNIYITVQSGNFDKFGSGKSEIVIVKYDKALNTITKMTSFPGRKADITLTPDANFLVIYDQSFQFLRQNIKVKKFTKTFGLVWDVVVGENLAGTSQFYIFNLSGDILITGTKNYLVWIIRLNPAGKIIWNSTMPENDVMEITGAVRNETGLSLLSSTIQETKQSSASFNYKLRLYKFKL